MYALCVFGAVNTQGFVWKFLCAIYKFSFIHSFIPLQAQNKVLFCSSASSEKALVL